MLAEAQQDLIRILAVGGRRIGHVMDMMGNRSAPDEQGSQFLFAFIHLVQHALQRIAIGRILLHITRQQVQPHLAYAVDQLGSTFRHLGSGGSH